MMDTQVRYSLQEAIEQDRQIATTEDVSEKPEESRRGFAIDAYQIQVVIAIALVLSVFFGVITI